MDEGYNGWPNHETWVVNLWLSNDEPIYMYMQDVDLTTGEKFEIFYKFGVPYHLKKSILQDIGKHGSIKNVDWDKLAEAWNEE